MLVLEAKILWGLGLGLWVERVDGIDAWFITIGPVQVAAFCPNVEETK